jgi:hypothetical protein
MLNRSILEISKEQVGAEFVESFLRLGNNSLSVRFSQFVEQKLPGISLSIEETNQHILIRLLDGKDGSFSESDAQKFMSVMKNNKIPLVIDRTEQKEYFDNAVNLKILNTKYAKELVQSILSFSKKNLSGINIIHYNSNEKQFQFKIVAREDSEHADEHLQKFYNLLEVAGLVIDADYRPDGKNKNNRSKLEDAINLLRKKTNESIILLVEEQKQDFDLLMKIIEHTPEPRKTGLKNYLNNRVNASAHYINTIHDVLVENNYSQDLTLFIQKFPELMSVLLGDEIVKVMQRTGFSNFLSLRTMALNLLQNNSGLSALTRACGVSSSPAGIALLRKMETQFRQVDNTVPKISASVNYMNKMTNNPRRVGDTPSAKPSINTVAPAMVNKATMQTKQKNQTKSM